MGQVNSTHEEGREVTGQVGLTIEEREEMSKQVNEALGYLQAEVIKLDPEDPARTLALENTIIKIVDSIDTQEES